MVVGVEEVVFAVGGPAEFSPVVSDVEHFAGESEPIEISIHFSRDEGLASRRESDHSDDNLLVFPEFLHK